MKPQIMALIAAGVCGLCLGVQPAQATLITIHIEALVDSVDDPAGWLEGKINPGDIITGTYTYDSTTPDTNPSAYVADYEHFAYPAGIYLSVGGFDLCTDPTNVVFVVEIINDYTSGGLHDAYGLLSYNNLPLSNGASVDRISWWLTDTSATALSSTDLPTTPPVLDEWESIYGLRVSGERDGYIIDAHVTSAIPEPGTIALLTIGTLLLIRKQN